MLSEAARLRGSGAITCEMEDIGGRGYKNSESEWDNSKKEEAE